MRFFQTICSWNLQNKKTKLQRSCEAIYRYLNRIYLRSTQARGECRWKVRWSTIANLALSLPSSHLMERLEDLLSPCNADMLVRRERERERWKKIEKRRKRAYVDVTRGAVALRSVMTARKGRLDCANGRNNNDLLRKSREGLSGTVRSCVSNYNLRYAES